MTVEREPGLTDGRQPIVITDTMKLWGRVLAALISTIEPSGLSDTVKFLSAYAHACDTITLNEEERRAVRHLLAAGRLDELAAEFGSLEVEAKPDTQTDWTELFTKLRQWDMARRLAVIRMSAKPINPKLRGVASSMIQVLAVDEANRVVPLTADDTSKLVVLLNAGQISSTEEALSHEETTEGS